MREDEDVDEFEEDEEVEKDEDLLPDDYASQYEAHERQSQAQIARQKSQRQAFLKKFMLGPDLISWIAPPDGVVPDEVLGEHLAQLQNVVRYTLQFALSDGYSIQTSLLAANTATRMIRTSIALSKALNATDAPNTKTIHGGRRKKRPQN